MDRLQAILRRIDGRSYPAYRDLEGRFELGERTLIVDRVQGDPFAAPSRVRLRVPSPLAPAHDVEAVEDWLLRRVVDALRGIGRTRGSGKSGQIHVYGPGPEITERSALRLLASGEIEIRLGVGLPARGRRVLGAQAQALLCDDLGALADALADRSGLDAHRRSVRLQRGLRGQLRARGLVAFLADGSVLPRRSGVATGPLPDAVPLRAPPGLAVELDGPDGPIRGLGIPEGVTVIVGGGFHGKSTLLDALAHGHLDHIPGDGRERVVCEPHTVKLRAEDGRRVAHVDISAFLGELPGGRDTRCFATEDASGSTSQAAAIIEAIEVGARTLLFDEDTCATNLMVRDARMDAVVPSEPITPLVQRVRSLHRDLGVSSVLVIGGVADYLGAADTVIAMDAFHATDAREAAQSLDIQVAHGPLPAVRPRAPMPLTGEVRVRARDTRAVQIGREEVELTAIEQVLDAAHAATIGEAVRLVGTELANGRRTLPQVLDALDAILDDEGVEALSARSWPDGRLVRPRRHEIAAALNRLRSMDLRPG